MASFVILSLALSGCLFGGGGEKDKEQTVEEFIASFNSAVSELDAAKISGLFNLPVTVEVPNGSEIDAFDDTEDDDTPGNMTIEITADDVVAVLGEPLNILKTDDNLVWEFALKVPEGGELDVMYDSTGNYAIAGPLEMDFVLGVSQETAEAAVKALVVKAYGMVAEKLPEGFLPVEPDQLDELINSYADAVWSTVLGLVLDADEDWPELFPLEGLGPMELPLHKVSKKWKISLDAFVEVVIEPATALFAR